MSDLRWNFASQMRSLASEQHTGSSVARFWHPEHRLPGISLNWASTRHVRLMLVATWLRRNLWFGIGAGRLQSRHCFAGGEARLPGLMSSIYI